MFNPVIFQSVFKNTTNSYKYYWWLAIIELISQDPKKITLTFSEIIITILSKIWYPVNYYKLSFGKQDMFADCVLRIKEEFNLNDDIKERDLIHKLKTLENHLLLKDITEFLTRYVPYRFLRPWFSVELRGIRDSKVNTSIIDLQKYKEHELPYLIDVRNNSIILNDPARTWMIHNLHILESYTYFELLKHLEENNKNVPGLHQKLIKPGTRNLSAATTLWKSFIQKYGTFKGVFNDKSLSEIRNLSIDHYLPWSFVTHDMIWNLHPVEKSINSSKGNLLPSEKYFNDFVQLQYEFSRFIVGTKNKALEDFYYFLKVNNSELKDINESKFTNKYRDFYLPQFEVAYNMGYEKDWEFK